MINIMFVCHGNICRSPMAEFVFKDMIEKENLQDLVYIGSAATSTEEIGSPVHPGTRNKLQEHGISSKGKYAAQLLSKDYAKYDYFIGMDHHNLYNMNKLFNNDPEHKVRLLLDGCLKPGDIADPWYTGDFETTYQDVKRGCEKLLEDIKIKIKEENYR